MAYKSDWEEMLNFIKFNNLRSILIQLKTKKEKNEIEIYEQLPICLKK